MIELRPDGTLVDEYGRELGRVTFRNEAQRQDLEQALEQFNGQLEDLSEMGDP